MTAVLPSAPYSGSFFGPGAKRFDPDEQLEHDVGHRIAIGAAVGFVAVGVIVGLSSLWAGLSVGSSLALAAFSGFWSGSVPGGLVGGLTVINREAARLARENPDAPALH